MELKSAIVGANLVFLTVTLTLLLIVEVIETVPTHQGYRGHGHHHHPKVHNNNGGSLSNPGHGVNKEEYFPYQVFLSREDLVIFCGGVILNPYVILTAAHCLDYTKENELEVIAGTTNRRHRRSRSFYHPNEEAVQIRKSSFFHIPETYNSLEWFHDIGLIVLKTPLHFDNSVNHIKLPKKNEDFRGSVTITILLEQMTGDENHKAIENNDDYLDHHSLKNFTFPIIRNQDCKALWSSTFEFMPTDKDTFCAGDGSPGHCDGNGGSPAVCTRRGVAGFEIPEPILCGIAQSDVRCAHNRKNGIPTEYTNVASHMEWIHNTTQMVLSEIKCNQEHFFCRSDKTCIPRKAVCDRENDCAGGEDEEDCVEFDQVCGKDEFRCNDGECLSKELLCDDNFDCDDGSDEDKCKGTDDCGGLHNCGEQDRCIPVDWKCDGLVDCNNESDEIGCSNNNDFNSTLESENEIAARLKSVKKDTHNWFEDLSESVLTIFFTGEVHI